MDFRNKFSYHLAVALFSLVLTVAFYLSGISLIRATAGTAFFLLFLTLIIGPIMRLWRPALEAMPWNLPWSWRGEIGIWFTIMSIIHVLLIFYGRNWDAASYMAGMRLSDLAGFIALFLALILTASSFGRVINFLGISSWRWLHGLAYVIFYLVGLHVINHAFLRPGRPDSWIHWMYLAMLLMVVALQAGAFVKTVADYRKKLKIEDTKNKI